MEVPEPSKMESSVAKAAAVHTIPKDGGLGQALLVLDNRTKRVLYMTVGKAFANLLLTALSLPLSILTGILAGATYLKPVGCVANVFASVRDAKRAQQGASVTNFDADTEATGPGSDQAPGSPSSDSPPEKKKKVGRKKKAVPCKKANGKLTAKQVEAKSLRTAEEEHRWHTHIYKQLIMHHNVEVARNSKKQYRCSNAQVLQNCSIMATELKGRKCSQCKEEMTVEVIPDTGLNCITDAQEVVLSETLNITPLTTVHSLVELMFKKKELNDLTNYDMRHTTVGIKEVLQLAHAALTSAHPLSQVFSSESSSDDSKMLSEALSL